MQNQKLREESESRGTAHTKELETAVAEVEAAQASLTTRLHKSEQQAAAAAVAAAQQQDEQSLRLAFLQSQFAELEEAAEQVAKLTDNLEAQHKQLEAGNSRQKQLQQKLLEMSTQLRQEQSAHEGVKNQLSRSQAEHAELAAQLQQIQLDIALQVEQLTTERDEGFDRLEGLQRQLADQPSEGDLAKAEARIASLQQDSQKHKQLLQQALADNVSAQARAEEQKNLQQRALQELQGDLDNKQADAEQAQHLMSDQTAQLSTLHQQLKQQLQQLQASSEKLALAESEHEQQTTGLKAELADAQARVANYGR